MVISSTGDVVVNGGKFVAKNDKECGEGAFLEEDTGNNLKLHRRNTNAQGKKRYSNGSTANFSQKGNL
ncbi:adhesin, partial [Escherichia coli]|nr:adhesin [Escherichia coli]